MDRRDIDEASDIVRRAMDLLMLTISEGGRTGADARTAIRAMLTRLYVLLHGDALGPPLDECFDLARKAGATLPGIINVQQGVAAEKPERPGGKLVQDCLINFCLATEARILIDMTMRSREDVERIRKNIHLAFLDAEEMAADAMDSTTYQALIKLHAATVRHLVDTGRPLPRMLLFRFGTPLSTLHAGHRLYDDAGRADELRDENKVVHPAFMRHIGRALSA